MDSKLSENILTLTQNTPPEEVNADGTKEEGFHFFIPMEKSYLEKAISSKADKDPKSWKIGGYASSNDTDLEGESIDPYGIDTSYFLKFGYFNDDHQKGAAHKVGIPTEAFVDEKGLYVRGYLLKDIPEAQGIYRLMQTLASGSHDRQVGFSVEGKVLEQAGGRILKCWIKDIAITANPVNTKTFAELIKSLKEKYSSVEPEPDLIKKSESDTKDPSSKGGTITIAEVRAAAAEVKKAAEDSVPLAEIKEHTGVDKKHFEKIIQLADEISQEAKALLSEDKEEFGKAMEAGHTTGNGGPEGQQTGGAALRRQDLDNELKVTTNNERIKDEDDAEIIAYTMKKSGIDDINTIKKIIKYAVLLQKHGEEKS